MASFLLHDKNNYLCKLSFQPVSDRVAFIGPSGVGKTLSLCKLLAQEVFIEASKLLYKEHLKYKSRANKGSGIDGDVKVPIKINAGKGERKQGGCC